MSGGWMCMKGCGRVFPECEASERHEVNCRGLAPVAHAKRGPKPSVLGPRKLTGVRFPHEMRAELEKRAGQSGESISATVVRAVQRDIDRAQ